MCARVGLDHRFVHDGRPGSLANTRPSRRRRWVASSEGEQGERVQGERVQGERVQGERVQGETTTG